MFILMLAPLFVSAPLFASDHALKESLKDFQKQTVPREKYLAALGAQIRGIELGDLSKILSAAELAAFNEAKTFVTHEIERLKLLQESLTPQDIGTITQGRPQSLYLRTGRFMLFEDGKGCSEEKYKKLKESYSVLDLYRFGIPAMAFVPASEMVFERQYKRALQKLLNSEPRLKDFAGLAQTALDPDLEEELSKRHLLPFLPMREKDRQAEAERFRRSLIMAGLKEGEAADYALTMAAKSPECLGQINGGFLRQVRADFAREQVNAFARKYMEKLKVKDARKPEDITELTDIKEPLLKSLNDPWGNRLIIDGGRVVSPGEDRKLGTPDDIRSDLL